MDGNNRISYVAAVDDDERVCRSFDRLPRTIAYQSVTYLGGRSVPS